MQNTSKVWLMTLALLPMVAITPLKTFPLRDIQPHRSPAADPAPTLSRIPEVRQPAASPVRAPMSAMKMIQKSPTRRAIAPAKKIGRNHHKKYFNKSARAMKQAPAKKLAKKTSKTGRQTIAKRPNSRQQRTYLFAVQTPRNNNRNLLAQRPVAHRPVAISRQNAELAFERAASHAASESYRQNSERHQARRQTSALASAHVSGVFKEE